MRICRLSPAEVTTPARELSTPEGPTITCCPSTTSGFGKRLKSPCQCVGGQFTQPGFRVRCAGSVGNNVDGDFAADATRNHREQAASSIEDLLRDVSVNASQA